MPRLSLKPTLVQGRHWRSDKRTAPVAPALPCRASWPAYRLGHVCRQDRTRISCASVTGRVAFIRASPCKCQRCLAGRGIRYWEPQPRRIPVGRVLIPDVKRRRIGLERITAFPVRICVCRPFGLLGWLKALRRYCRRRNETKIANSRRALIEAFRHSLRVSSVWMMCLETSERVKPATGSYSARWRSICI